LTAFTLSAVIGFGSLLSSTTVSAAGLDDFNRAGVKLRGDGTVDDNQPGLRAGVGARPVGRVHIEHGALGHHRGGERLHVERGALGHHRGGGERMERISRGDRVEAVHRSGAAERPHIEHFGIHR
jgi:hypothetical protein